MATEKELCDVCVRSRRAPSSSVCSAANYQESKCAEVIKRYYDCCAAAKEAEQKTRTTSS
ncbi:Cysteine alpha-hairpin motif superfamily [Phytophthora cactorum]|nr:Cysteine alpha-hairpin motif superfamily [Phytophthora cactorum]